MPDMSPHAEPHPDVAGYLLGALTVEEAAAFAEHLRDCAPCRQELEELAELPCLLADMPPSEPLPPDLERRTFAAIERAAGEDYRAGVPGDNASGRFARSAGAEREDGHPNSGAGERTVVPFHRSAPAASRRRQWLFASVAAVLAAIAGVGVLSSVNGQSPSSLATVRLAAAGAGSAHGTATIRVALAGLTIDMDVHDLAPSPSGTFYTCWLIGPGDTLSHQHRVSVGSFVVGSGHSAHVHWTTAADLRRYPTLGVTLEPDNGNPLHQGPKVLVAI